MIDAIAPVFALCSTLVVFPMKACFASRECGITRPQNRVGVTLKKLTNFCLSTIIFWLFGFAILTASGSFFSAFAQAANSDGARKINLAGRQRMLIQRAGKFVCLAYLDTHRQHYLQNAADALALFDRTARALRDGDEELGLHPENHGVILKALTAAQDAYRPYAKAIKSAIQSRAVSHESLTSIAKLNDPALIAMDETVHLIERFYRTKKLSRRVAVFVNIAGRQRMFTQNMMLQKCLANTEQNTRHAKSQLLQVIQRFGISLNILKKWRPQNVEGSLLSKLDNGLSTVQVSWDELRPLFERTAEGALNLSADEISNLDTRTEQLLVQMNDVVSIYKGISG